MSLDQATHHRPKFLNTQDPESTKPPPMPNPSAHQTLNLCLYILFKSNNLTTKLHAADHKMTKTAVQIVEIENLLRIICELDSRLSLYHPSVASLYRE